jgi:hypothetical protein
MSLLTNKLSAGSEKVNYKLSEGWTNVKIIALADIGEHPNKFNDGKMQPKFSVLFASNEKLNFPSGDVATKTHTETFVASLHEKSNLVAKYLSPAGISIESLDELLGKTLKLKFKLTEDGKYLNVVNCDESDGDVEVLPDTYVPKFWKQDKDGVKTGYEIMVSENVIDGVLEAITDSPIVQAEEDDIYA